MAVYLYQVDVPARAAKFGIPIGVDLPGAIEERDHRKFIEHDEHDRRSGSTSTSTCGDTRREDQMGHRWREEEEAGNDQRDAGLSQAKASRNQSDR